MIKKKYLVIISILAWLIINLPNLQKILAINKVNNWNFNGNSTGWFSTDNTGTDVCGSGTSAADTGQATFAYNGNAGGQTAFQLVTNTGKNIKARGMIYQTITAPGSGTVKIKGMISYYGISTAWNATPNTSWVRLDIFDSNNTTLIANLACISFNTDQGWTNTSWSSNVDLAGGTTYTIRATLRGNNKNTNNSPAVTIAIDNINISFAPVGLTSSPVSGSSNVLLNWTGSTGGTGVNGLHPTTPYKIYRDTTSPVTTFLSNGTTNVYTDSTTLGNTTYYYAISDLDTASDESPLSVETSLLTNPGSPVDLSFINVDWSNLRVGWTAPPNGATSYKVERCSGVSCSNFSQITFGETNLYYDDTNLTGNTLYRYRIRATNNSGDGAYSIIGEITTQIEPIYSVSILPGGIISYGVILGGDSKSTIDIGQTQVAVNQSTVAAKLNIGTSQAVGGIPWEVGLSAGSNIFVHEFSPNSGVGWTKFENYDYYTLTSNAGVGQTINFDLRVTAPTDSDTLEKTINITVQAVQL